MGNSLHSHTVGYSSVMSMRALIKIGALVALFLFAYAGATSMLVRTWIRDYGYAYVVLVPLVSLYFFYAERERLHRLSVEPMISGGTLLVLIACIMLLIGKTGSIVMLQQLSIAVVIPGAVLMLLGTGYLRALSFPLAYLILMIPLLDIIKGTLHWPVQILSATIATTLLKAVNIPVMMESQFIMLPHITLEVAEECSGVRYLIAILFMGIPLAYLTQRGPWRRMVLIIFGIAIGVFANGLRIALIGISTYVGGEMLHGPMHIFQGLFVAVVGFCFLIIGAYALTWIPGRRPSIKNTGWREVVSNGKKRFYRAFSILAAIFLLTGTYLHLHSPRAFELDPEKAVLPERVGKWIGEEPENQEELVNIRGADFELSRVYRDESGRKVKVYFGYFETQRQDKELVSYETESLYKDAEAVEIPLHSGNKVTVNRTILHDGLKKSLVLFWYDLNGRIVTNRYLTKLISGIDGLLYRRTNGAFIAVHSALDGTEDAESVFDIESDIVRGILPALRSFSPGGDDQVRG